MIPNVSYDDLLERNEKLGDRIFEMERVLERLEWDDCDYEMGCVYCKICEQSKEKGHSENCLLKKCLQKRI